MLSKANSHAFDAPAMYCIAVGGSLGPELARRFGELTAVSIPWNNGGTLTLLVGRLPDQAALLGVLNYLYNLTIPIWMVLRLETIAVPAEGSASIP